MMPGFWSPESKREHTEREAGRALDAPDSYNARLYAIVAARALILESFDGEDRLACVRWGDSR
jgi:hypothetical protein